MWSQKGTTFLNVEFLERAMQKNIVCIQSDAVQTAIFRADVCDLKTTAMTSSESELPQKMATLIKQQLLKMFEWTWTKPK